MNPLQGVRTQCVQSLLRARLYRYESYILENFEMLGNLRLPQPEPGTDGVHRSRSRAKELHDAESVGLTEYCENVRVHDQYIDTRAYIRISEYIT
jgi:hypothetical protein